jgi:pimeloyl-ACP methyl ester carboxylesterase
MCRFRQTEKTVPWRARAVALVSLALVPTLAGAEAAPPVLAWGACPPAAPGAAPTDALECSTLPTPMDHADPSGPTFSLALIRAPAHEPGARIGTLFWNPGGPGDAGTAYLPAAIGGFPAEVRDRFDIVSWDPRGMGGRTTPVVQCFDSAEAEAAFLAARLSDNLPVTPEELAADAAGRAAFNAACVERNGDLLAHVSTADNARDLDLLREAVGEETLSYYGTSYGTFLGATYVNMFPERVRAAVLDGAVTPSAWAGGPGEDTGLGTFVRIGSDFGTQQAIGAFMDQCGAVDAAACAFSAGSPEATRQKWNDLLKRAAAGLTVDGRIIRDGDLLSYVGALTYTVSPVPGFDRFPGWVAVATFLERAATGTADPDVPSADGSSAPGPEAAAYVTSAGRQLSVVCGESPNPETEAAFVAQVEASYARAGHSAWPFVAACHGWTARAADPYLGPWDNPTPVPILVIGNTYDPATPLASSVRMAQELADARLLIVNGFGHTVLINPSRCAQDHVAAYLIDGRLPPAGASCSQDTPPFPGD